MSPTIWTIALDPSVRRRALRISLVVGTILAIINYGDRIIMGGMDGISYFKCTLTYLVPYAVSTYSSVMAVKDRKQTLERD